LLLVLQFHLELLVLVLLSLVHQQLCWLGHPTIVVLHRLPGPSVAVLQLLQLRLLSLLQCCPLYRHLHCRLCQSKQRPLQLL
jgi:hypothetical protein